MKSHALAAGFSSSPTCCSDARSCWDENFYNTGLSSHQISSFTRSKRNLWSALSMLRRQRNTSKSIPFLEQKLPLTVTLGIPPLKRSTYRRVPDGIILVKLPIRGPRRQPRGSTTRVRLRNKSFESNAL